ncbi:hypothetical protein BH10PLA1_BH10PLA1_09130 [soil metagenome]
MSSPKTVRSRGTFRVGRVTVYSRGKTWYLRYHEHGQRQQVRASTDLSASRQLAAKVNVQLETGVPAATSFEQISIEDLRTRWLEHHEHVKRSSVHTINRYRTATDYIIRFVNAECRRVRHVSEFSPREAEAFARWLRTLEISPNGHKNSIKRRLLDKGISYILESCRTLFAYAIRRRHLPPYTENPFSAIEIDSITIENAKPIILLSVEEERQMLQASRPHEYPVLLTLLLTGMRPGELCHLLLPNDLDLEKGWVRISNKPRLGWQVKTRCERAIPLHPFLVDVLRKFVGGRNTGAVFRQQRCGDAFVPILEGSMQDQLEREVVQRIAVKERQLGRALDRREVLALQRKIWRDLGAMDEDNVRHAFIRVCRENGLPHQTAPKVLRHGFATMLQDANVDPLVRNLLMGHSAASAGSSVVRQTALGMTGVYTHTRPETIRKQLIDALDARGVVQA